MLRQYIYTLKELTVGISRKQHLHGIASACLHSSHPPLPYCDFIVTMILFSFFVSALVVAAVTSAQLEGIISVKDSLSSPEPCAVVSSSSSAFYAATPTRKYPQFSTSQKILILQLTQEPATTLPQIPASIAYACQLSAPFSQNLSVALIDYIVPYINFQSDLAYLKNPPSTYLMPAVDILGGLEEIRQNASAGTYPSQYAFDAALFDLVAQAHDGHFIYVPALVGAFQYYNDIPLISISGDGLSLPKVYVQSKSFDLCVCVVL
jgi:hypothetical protein